MTDRMHREIKKGDLLLQEDTIGVVHEATIDCVTVQWPESGKRYYSTHADIWKVRQWREAYDSGKGSAHRNRFALHVDKAAKLSALLKAAEAWYHDPHSINGSALCAACGELFDPPKPDTLEDAARALVKALGGMGGRMFEAEVARVKEFLK